MTYAPAPTRATGRLIIQFGLVSVPVDVFNGVEEDANKISRNMRAIGTGAPVRFTKTDAETGEILNSDEIKMVVVLDDGTEVDLADDEIDKAMGLTNGSCDLLGFFPVSQLHLYETKALYQVRPQAVKVGKKTTHPNAKPFALLMHGMKATGTFALLTYVMRGRLHVAGLVSDGTLYDYYWVNELRDERPTEEADVTEKEAATALMLVDALRQDTVPSLDNEAVKRVHDYVAAKAAGQLPAEQAEAQVHAEVLDLEALLAASLEQATAK